MSTGTKSKARLNFRLSPRHKSMIEKAAGSVGQSVSEFAVGTLVRGAQATLQGCATTTLTLRDMRRFVAMLGSAGEPNEALRCAARRHNEGGKARG